MKLEHNGHTSVKLGDTWVNLVSDSNHAAGSYSSVLIQNNNLSISMDPSGGSGTTNRSIVLDASGMYVNDFYGKKGLEYGLGYNLDASLMTDYSIPWKKYNDDNYAKISYVDGSLNAKVDKADKSYGQLYIHDASLVKSIPTGATYIPLGPWTVSDISANMTFDASKYVMKPQQTGKYIVNGHISFATDTNTMTTRGVVFQGETECNWIHFADFRGVGANIIQSSSFVGILDVSTLDTSIGLRIKHDHGSAVIYTIYYANMNIHRIGE